MSKPSDSAVLPPLRVSVILPAKNEAEPLADLLPRIRGQLPGAEIIVVDDGSTDATAETAARCGARVLSHPYSKGNGAAIKTGARVATGDVLVFLDADGQHDAADIPRLLAEIEHSELVVGSRDPSTHASLGRRLANAFYNWFAGYMTGQRVPDLTSGFRVARAGRFREFLYLLPNGFSYPTTSTMAFFRAGYSVSFVPIHAGKRTGTSHIRPVQDGIRFLLIIFKVGTLYSPLKLFFPVSGSFGLVGLSYYCYTFVTQHRFTNMSALMLTTAVLVFLIGLVSEQITQLNYRPHVAEARTSRLDDSRRSTRETMRDTGT